MFSASRLLSSSRYLLRRNALPCKKIGECGRALHVACVPPRNKVSNSELCTMGLALFLSMWTVPFWIMYQIPVYQNENRNEYTGR